ncbi:hypothetical protein ACHAW5_002729 [Stephanodiscus triporus]|uniref:polyribonucleotide nucleotidyltransferase n=1 Tax=Stephanodiscus triporus TaxID=2934178 RepID=A0ABD3P545_9STRA
MKGTPLKLTPHSILTTVEKRISAISSLVVDDNDDDDDDDDEEEGGEDEGGEGATLEDDGPVDDVAAEAEAAGPEPFKLILEDVPPPSFAVVSSESGSVHTLTMHLGKPGHPEPIVVETGRIGRQASAAVTLTRGDTVLYATACRDKDRRDGIDFLPLSVEHQERFSSAGMTSGAFNKRDGRPAEHEILVCRLIDRPIRPLIADGWRHETQLLSWILSYDGVRTCDPLAVTASAAALWLSDVPLSKPVAAAMVGYVDGRFVLNPTLEQMKHSRLNLTVAGTKDAVLMIEGAADFLPEELMVEAVSFGHDAIRIQCQGLEELGKVAGKEKKYDSIDPFPEGLREAMESSYSSAIDDIYSSGGPGSKADQSAATSALSSLVMEEMEALYPDEKYAIKSELKDLMCRRMYELASSKSTRIDGRRLDEIRAIDADVGLFPRVHGSALFTRGQTQVVATATLGDSGMRQKIDRISGMEQKRFYLQYTFPPSCVGETGRVGAPGRREVGHGNLAERALLPALPSEEDFPYAIRVESLVTESNGSSSMASVCGGCLALMDAGVPIVSPIAGIAMGMLLKDKRDGGGVATDDNAVILSDILGTEDALGTMDFKVAGNREGITTFQLDIKCEGLTLQTMKRALDQAKVGRLHILSEMEKALRVPRAELPSTVPKVMKMKISEDSIGKVIGPGGRQIRALIEDFGLTNIDVEENGEVQLSGFDMEQIKKAKEMIVSLTSSTGGGGRRGGGGGGRGGAGGELQPRPEYVGTAPEEGKTYTGKITGIHQFGVFLEILPGAEDGSTPGLEGLCHVSDLHIERVRSCEGFVRGMNTETLEVIYLGKNKKGQHQLSRKAVLEARGVKPRGGGGRDYGGRRMESRQPDGPAVPETQMSKEEMDVIANAIENATE